MLIKLEQLNTIMKMETELPSQDALITNHDTDLGELLISLHPQHIHHSEGQVKALTIS